MNAHEFLISPIGFLAPEKLLDGLTAKEAEQRPKEGMHSVAEIVAHLSFWQDWFYARCSNRRAEMVASAADGWPPVAPGSWPELRSRFLDRLQQLASLADGDVTKPVTPAIEFRRLRITRLTTRSFMWRRTTRTIWDR
jgi:hypothetical protein